MVPIQVNQGRLRAGPGHLLQLKTTESATRRHKSGSDGLIRQTSTRDMHSANKIPAVPSLAAQQYLAPYIREENTVRNGLQPGLRRGKVENKPGTAMYAIVGRTVLFSDIRKVPRAVQISQEGSVRKGHGDDAKSRSPKVL